MKIALIGYGKMGRMIEKVATEADHSITVRLTSKHWCPEDLIGADVCIEFTHADAVLDNIKKIVEAKKPVVIGTTGWEEKKEQVQSLIEDHQTGAIYSPNFSIGAHLMFEILSQASKVMRGFNQYDVAGIECHHKDKKDSPSGTALKMVKIMEENMKRSKIPFSSLRCGSIPGTHSIVFDSPFDKITLTHEARTGEGFAHGALQAAEWIEKKKGFYNFEECLRDLMKGKEDET